MTSARPAPKGKATAMPATEMAATKSRFPRLKIIPPTNASNPGSECCAIEIVKETYRSRRIRPAQGETEQKGAHQNPPHVVPVVQLESPRLCRSSVCWPNCPSTAC
jgi:hypothetical protein